ncbi:MAG TPA: DUF1697 domain-containing protein [Polyangia bacterium]
MAPPPRSRCVALLRGINVGGNNLIKMAALKATFEGMGFQDVATYIQSGNVVFTAPGKAATAAKLAPTIEAALAARFSYQASVVLRSEKEMRAIVARAPEGFGAEPAKYRYDVIYLKAPLTAASVIEVVPVKPGVDQATAGTGVLYFSRLISKASSSRLGKIVTLPLYSSVTIRNWNTTIALLRLLDGEAR